MPNYIELLNLEPHPEGGYFRSSFRSTDSVIVNERYDAPNTRLAGSAIYYYLEANDFSAWHRIKSDEIWHFYDGTPVLIHVLHENGEYEQQLIGNTSHDNAAAFQLAIRAGTWFAAELQNKNSFALLGCTVSPGFEYKDFEMAKHSQLLKQFPQHEEIILRFCK